MKKALRKITSLIASVALAASTTLAFAAPAVCLAEETTNKLPEKTTEYLLPYKGSLDFEFTMPKSSYFYIEATPTWCIPDKSAYIMSEGLHTRHSIGYSITANYKKYESGTISSACGIQRTGCYGFKPGTKVSFHLGNGDTAFAFKMNIRVVVKSPKSFESESNDTKSKATMLSAGKGRNGLIFDGDTDYYCFKAPQTKTYRFKAVSTSSGGFWANLYKGSKVLSSASVYSGDGWKTVGKVSMKKGEKIYFKISTWGGSPNYIVKVS